MQRTTVSAAIDLDRREFNWELAAESITLRIRWFGLCVGYLLVNFVSREANQPALNAILTLGLAYALVDTWWSWRGRVFLSDGPLFISLMEAVFIGLLCYFDDGFESPFRFYYFLSLLVCSLRYPRWITWTTFGMHALSFGTLAIGHSLHDPEARTTLFLTLLLMGWVTWASTAFSRLIKTAGRRLTQLNLELQENQALLEHRIGERTKELQRSQALLVQQEKQAAFGLLAAGIAHEVGNPLAAISSLVQMLNRRPQDDYTRERLHMVDDQLRRIQRTLRELVDFSRPALNQKSLCDVHDAIDAALSIAKYYKRKKGKQIVTRYAPGVPRLHLVRDQMVQVFLNLILNAMDATEEGGTIEITTSLQSGCLKITIRDDGHGISASARESMFQPYITTKENGTGLGLFVCRNLVEQMDGGRIELTETSEQGTTFAVSLTSPALQGQPDSLPDGFETELRDVQTTETRRHGEELQMSS